MNSYTIFIFFCFSLSLSAKQAFADSQDRFRQTNVPKTIEMVTWVGEVRDNQWTHTTSHIHALEFVKKGDDEKYNIVGSPDLVKIHHETGKNYLVEVTAERSPRFLFWQGDLRVKSFRILNETSEAIPHGIPTRTGRIGG